MHFKYKLTFLLIAFTILFSSCSNEKKAPNVVIILADDLGYGDPQVYNSESKIPTPNIDNLASEGMRFTDAHSPSSVCTPTRYGILTGRYAWRTDLKEWVLKMWDKPLIEKNRLTFPKLLKTKNYQTACIGKWHLGWLWPSNINGEYMNDTIAIGNNTLKDRNNFYEKIDFSKPLGGGPLEAGFDYYYGDDVPNFAPYAFFENDKLLEIPNHIKPKNMYGAPGPMAEGWDLTNVMPKITEKAVNYIEQESKKEHPFFLYFALTAPHTPIAPTNQFKGKSQAGLYGDFVNEVDWSVGQIIKALKKSGQYENTLLIFTSDNGSPQRDGTNMGGEITSVKKYGHDPSKPWRGIKADAWEGGHRVPFIVTWPKKIKKNTVSNQLVCQTDIISTVCSILGIEKDTNSMEDSYDISTVLLGKDNKNSLRQTIVHHSGDGTFAIRKENWKLILGKNSGGFSKNLKIEGFPVETKGQLYNLDIDPSEQHNQYDINPEKVKELTSILNQYKIKGYSNH
ncbi:sulfatase family protein [Aestuariibaculum suncheonense]|uniref:Arylsulfatase n=1 Tax=Aestuariibaculum suncheonense TaxID=1028745 RepID=A0A8J6QIQ0_9FLAO|nr:arylsulfatase [Aestuariibaculum suncheonense]MBD0836202.1 arylsulfatase [Aestuariibaculum suncheonense]